MGVDSSEALAPSDGSGGEAPGWANRQRHGGEGSGRAPCTEGRRRTINRLMTTELYTPSRFGQSTDLMGGSGIGATSAPVTPES